jgi:hypothetical protein
MYTNQYRDVFTTMAMGFRASKATATVPQSTTQDIFVVSGGFVLVKLLYGVVTVEIGAGTTPDLQVQHDPTTGTTIDLATDVVIASDEVGTIYYVEGDGTALIPISSGYGQAAAGGGFFLPVGTIQIATTESTAGSTRWEIFYFPLDEGASIASA